MVSAFRRVTRTGRAWLQRKGSWLMDGSCFCIWDERMKVLVPVKRVVDFIVKVRVKSANTGGDIANLNMSMNPFDDIAVEEPVHRSTMAPITHRPPASCPS